MLYFLVSLGWIVVSYLTVYILNSIVGKSVMFEFDMQDIGLIAWRIALMVSSKLRTTWQN